GAMHHERGALKRLGWQGDKQCKSEDRQITSSHGESFSVYLIVVTREGAVKEAAQAESGDGQGNLANGSHRRLVLQIREQRVDLLPAPVAGGGLLADLLQAIPI